MKWRTVLENPGLAVTSFNIAETTRGPKKNDKYVQKDVPLSEVANVTFLSLLLLLHRTVFFDIIVSLEFLLDYDPLITFV